MTPKKTPGFGAEPRANVVGLNFDSDPTKTVELFISIDVLCAVSQALIFPAQDVRRFLSIVSPCILPSRTDMTVHSNGSREILSL